MTAQKWPLEDVTQGNIEVALTVVLSKTRHTPSGPERIKLLRELISKGTQSTNAPSVDELISQTAALKRAITDEASAIAPSSTKPVLHFGKDKRNSEYALEVLAAWTSATQPGPAVLGSSGRGNGWRD